MILKGGFKEGSKGAFKGGFSTLFKLPFKRKLKPFGFHVSAPSKTERVSGLVNSFSILRG